MTQLIEAARRYTGVRFVHRGRSKNGLDCAGLIWRAYSDCGLALPDFRLYGREPHKNGLIKYVSAALGDPIATEPVRARHLQAGDVVVMRFEHEPHHLGIITDYPVGKGIFALLHADGNLGAKSRVLEVRLAPDMQERITHLYRRPI